ncbi:hypothetical protein ACFP1Z_25255 [Streptomyces gamaensis]|uniref:Uncharacterized protein n=1 Tax=Streptomyces gamaensis TaxID=1763542 RepID=A0ABW0Z4W6_9ACTN
MRHTSGQHPGHDPDSALRALVAHPPFPVHGLREPTVTPAALAEAHRVGGRWTSVTLAYGQWDSPAGPFVAVTTLAPDNRSARADPRSALTAAVELEEERYASLNDEQHPAASGPVDISEARIHCDPASATAALGRRGALWALVLDLDSQRLVTVGRGVEPGSVEVGQVQDLDPFLQGRSTLLQRMTEAVEHSAAPRPQPDVAGGRMDVPSHAAQRAWDQYWRAHPNRSDATPDARQAEPAHLTDILLPR